MKYSNLGRTGLKVSRIGLGTMNFGMETSEADSLAVLDAAVDAGINFVDTADVYGGPQSPDMKQGYGISEEYIGRWLAQASRRRDKIVLATKLYQPMGIGPNDRGLSAYQRSATAAGPMTGCSSGSSSSDRIWRPTRSCVVSSARRRPTSRWRGCSINRRSRQRSSARVPLTS
jgi:hypothetical protein